MQIDYVNVVVPAHYFVPFTRLGPYDRRALDNLVYRRREFTEQWAHEASIVPMDAWPLLRYRREAHRARPWALGPYLEQNAEWTEAVMEEVRLRGPLCADDLTPPDGAPGRVPGAWIGTVTRAALEAHFGRGRLAAVARGPNFARSYDLAERVIPPEHFHRTISADEAQRELVRRAARAYGVGTAADLADYYRMPVTIARERIAELVENNELIETRVEGWRQTAFLHPDAHWPNKIEAAALLAPFDPLIWYRDRAARLFGFDYRVEIFVPREQRKWGFYVLPFLLGDRFAARVDLKVDRAARSLRVLAAFLEPGFARNEVAELLSGELQAIAGWLGLNSVSVEGTGGLAASLVKARTAAR